MILNDSFSHAQVTNRSSATKKGVDRKDAHPYGMYMGLPTGLSSTLFGIGYNTVSQEGEQAHIM